MTTIYVTFKSWFEMFVFINLSLFISRWLTLLPITTSNECIKPYLIFTLSSPSYCPNLLCIFPLSTVMTLLQISLTSLSFRVFFVGGGAGSGGILTCQNTTASEAPPTCTDSSSWTLMEKKIPQTCWMDSVHIYDRSQMSLVKLALHTKADVKVLLRQCICMPSICMCIKFRRS